MNYEAKKPTLKDVAALANTSIATASVVLSKNTNIYVSDELRLKVIQAADKLKYSPNLLARRMKGKSRRFLAILVPQFENVFFNRVVLGAEHYANSHGYILSIFSTHDQEEKELNFIDNLIALQVDGILIAPSSNRSKSIVRLQEAGIPYVILDRKYYEPHHNFVGFDNYQAAFEGTKYLITQGHKQVVFFGWESRLNTIVERLNGFMDAFRAMGIEPDESLIFHGKRNERTAHELMLQILERHQFTAVFAALHHIGEGVVTALRDSRRRIPEDISVLIFGNPRWALVGNPAFTCINLPDLKMGMKAAALIINQLENSDQLPQEVIYKANLILRNSVAKLHYERIK